MSLKRTTRRSRKSLVLELDRVFSLYIRARDGQCIVCGTTENLQCGHLYSRIAYSTRWDETNAFGQCASCNNRAEYDWYPMLEAVKRRGIDVDTLHLKYSTPVKLTDYQLCDMIREYAEKLKQFG